MPADATSAPAPPAAFAPDPDAGRLFHTARVVRTTDVTPAGQLRLDAVARYLQEAAEDDVADAGWDEPYGWLLRKCALDIRRYPAHGEPVQVRTFCSGLGPRWAERTTTLAAGGQDVIQARAVWVAVTLDTGTPAPLGPGFARVYGPSAQGRTVSARLSQPAPDPAAAGRPWPLRACDFDPAGHVNNTVHWAAAEDAAASLGWRPAAAQMEYHQPLLPGQEPLLLVSAAGASADIWLSANGARFASARLTG